MLSNLKDSTKAQKAIIERLKKIRKESGSNRIGFVAGKLSSKKLLDTIKNFIALNNSVKYVKRNINFPIVSSLDFFFSTILIKLTSSEKINQDLWEKILKSGYITDIFMAPGWEESKGAVNEHQIAKKSGLKITYLHYSN
ncbi:MAG: DUF4406 domain-containing protein [Candidatus Levybacteria bacterium]|nr:DUF4406 domain-containing protein [Candidatus Levybacteria bacterium]